MHSTKKKGVPVDDGRFSWWWFGNTQILPRCCRTTRMKTMATGTPNERGRTSKSKEVVGGWGGGGVCVGSDEKDVE